MEPIVELLAYTPNPERLVAVAARRSYDRRPASRIWKEMSNEDVAQLLYRVIKHQHLSVLEHISFTFAIEGVSRVLSHQLVRHRLASYSQTSQQRTDETGFDFTIPPEIDGDHELAGEFRERVKSLAGFYTKAIDKGISKGQARYILPNACTTSVVMTMNGRSLFNLIAQRACGAEEWEFRMVATKIHQALLQIAPDVFKHAGPRCVTDLVCLEGEKGERCGCYKTVPGAVLRDGFYRGGEQALLTTKVLTGAACSRPADNKGCRPSQGESSKSKPREERRIPIA